MVVASLSIILGVVVLVVALLAPSGSSSNAEAALLAATNRTMGQSTFLVTEAGTTGLNGDPMPVHGTGMVNLSSHSTDFSETFDGRSVETRTVAGVAYSSTQGLPLPGGAKWMSHPVTDSGQASSNPIEDDLPFEGFQFLQHVKNVQVVGNGAVDNDKVTRYSFTIDLSSLVKSRDAGFSNVPGTAAIDDQGLIRQLGLSLSQSGGGETYTSNINMTYSNFGIPVNVAAPPPSEVVPASEAFGGLSSNS